MQCNVSYKNATQNSSYKNNRNIYKSWLTYVLRFILTGNKYNQFITQLYNKMEKKIDYTVVEKSG